MSDGGMHTSFNGLSSIREFSVAEVVAHLDSLCIAERAYLERTAKEFQRANGADKTDPSAQSQRAFVNLIESRVARYDATLIVAEALAKDTETVTLDISRELCSQILSMAAECDAQVFDDDRHPVAIIPDAVKKKLDL